jgi:S-formylglutathione hydrolase FrmB
VLERGRSPRYGRIAAALGALALAVVAAVVAAGRIADVVGVDERGADVETLEIDSRAVGRTLPTTVVVPEDAVDRPPLLVFLHGRGGDHRSELDGAFFAALDQLGDRAPVVALPDGGDDSYWHDRRDGRWGAYVVREVMPRVVERYGVDPRRVAIGGISMGGFGAYDIARLNPDRFCAVGGHSPAIWRSAGETAPGAFDDAADFARHDLIGAAERGQVPDAALWIDAGEEDPFMPGVEAFAATAPRVRLHVWPGGHDGGYWDEHWPDYARFYARALARC